ncbi:MAG: hypothetical protein NUV87_01065 [Candidatus Roizmanbacteria bacterium]|nr:hypothetical protein [Candidatus Roizmanbacteria bacterium]
MDNFTPLKTKNKKKINKFLVIGNLFLVVLIAVIGFYYYNNTLLTTQQKAAFDCDASIPGDCKAKGKAYEGSEQQEADREAKKKKEQEERRLEREEIGGGSCPGGYVTCEVTDTGGKGHRFCLDETKNTGCSNEAVDRGITMKTGIGVGSGLTEQGGWICEFGKNGYSGGPCLQNNSVKTIGNQKPPACFCGIIQIDGGQWDGTYQSSCGCGSKEQEAQTTTTLVGTIIPTPTGEEGIPTSTPTSTIVPTTVPTVPEATPTEIIFVITPTITPTPTIAKLVCATKDCNETTRPCAPGNICIKANDGSNYCSNESLVDSCKSSPTESSCCKIVPTSNATPTEIILAKTSISPTAVAKLLETGVVKSFIYLIPAAIMLIGLIL